MTFLNQNVAVKKMKNSQIIYSGELHKITAWRNITLDGAEWENHLKFSMVDSLW